MSKYFPNCEEIIIIINQRNYYFLTKKNKYNLIQLTNEQTDNLK